MQPFLDRSLHRARSLLKVSGDRRHDLTASVVVFLVALPLCVGVAVASGVPAELGLITGIVGGIVTGLLPGSSLQVSGPAAGMTVLVYEAVQEFGLPALGALVLAAGLLQLAMGALRLGRFFRAISVAVVEGMLAGIGLVLIAGQLYAMADQKAPASGLAKIGGLPELIADTFGSGRALAALALGSGTVAVLLLWRRLPAVFRTVPAPLAAVALATAVSLLFSMPVATVEVQGLVEAVQPPGSGAFGELLGLGAIGTVLAFALIASAESLFSAAAVDRLHDGPRTDYDKELVAQGAGNTVCGLLGALPMTAVIVRSAANVQAGARTKASRVLHGVWLLLFAALLPAALGLIPVAALAGVLVHAGCKLVPARQLAGLWREHRGEAVVLVVTALAIVSVSMFEGVLIGLALAVVKTAWETSHVHIEVVDKGVGPIRAHLSGNATFLRLPKILDALEALPQDRPIELDLTNLRHLDHACRTSLENWALRHSAEGTEPVRVASEV
ncbi:SulP family inorganic anion transporter [Streptomyces flavofungini]|uniref:SulP family inorganic anion transporter n=1 Tax=Streptomyces flavofungini TaxID=68200 RepID=UPI0025B21A35|nr:SulP family inorganic anion transporter [Streptomyces flavofungini]WJV45147.1 SulP family inorganic anion transporter [Streptomyces flavofungini]